MQKELNIYSLNGRTDDQRGKWLIHLKTMDNDRLPLSAFHSIKRVNEIK
jgi:hypothetical protein